MSDRVSLDVEPKPLSIEPAWTATVTEIATNQTNLVATVEFVNGGTGEQITRTVPANDLTPESLAFYCQRVIEQLEARDAAVAALSPGPVVLPRDAKAGPLAEAAAAKAAATDFFEKLATLNTLKAQVEKGIIKSDDPAIPDAEAAVKSAFLPEYASDPRF